MYPCPAPITKSHRPALTLLVKTIVLIRRATDPRFLSVRFSERGREDDCNPSHDGAPRVVDALRANDRRDFARILLARSCLQNIEERQSAFEAKDQATSIFVLY